jgi:hypothetical protein
MGNKDEDFNFKIKLTGTLDKHEITYAKQNIHNEIIQGVVESDEFEFTLRHGETIFFDGLLTNTKFTITEDKHISYKTTVEGADYNDLLTVARANGVIGENAEVVFTNTSESVVPTEIRLPSATACVGVIILM